MISESIYWRRDLFNLAKELRRKSTQRKWQEASVIRVEKALLIGCYAIRRLLDSAKLPRSYRDKLVSAVKLESLDVDLSRYRYAPPIGLEEAREMYDFQSGRLADLKLSFFINQFIHSHTLLYILPCDEMPKTAILVTSDRDRRKHLLAFWLDSIAEIFEHAAISKQIAISRTWNEASKEWIFDGTVAPDTELAEWGFATQAEVSDAIRRYDQKTSVGDLRDALAFLDEEFEEFLNGLYCGD